MSTIFRSLKSYDSKANEVHATRKALHKDIKEIKASVKSANKKTQAQMPTIKQCAEDMVALNKTIKRLERYYNRHKVIHFFTNKCLGRFSTLNRAIRERNLFTKVAPDDFKKDVDAKISTLKAAKKKKKKKQPKAEDKAPSNNKSQDGSKAASSEKKPQAEDKAPSDGQAISEEKAPNSKDNVSTDEKSTSSASEKKVSTNLNSSKDLPDVITLDIDKDEPAQEFTPEVFVQKFVSLFTEDDKKAAKALAEKTAKKFPDSEEKSETAEIAKRLGTLTEFGTFHLNKKRKYNKQFMEAIVFGYDDPTSFIVGKTGVNKIVPPFISDNQMKKAVEFLHNETVQQLIIAKIKENEADALDDETKLENIFANLARIKQAIRENQLTTTTPKQADFKTQMLSYFSKPTPQTRYISEEEIEQAIELDPKEFEKKFSLVY